MAAALAIAACVSQPPPKPAEPAPPVAPAAVVAHGAVSSSAARAERIDLLLRSGVTPVERSDVASYLDSLQANLRKAIAGNTAQLARVDDEVVVVVPARVLFSPDAAELTQAGEKFLRTLADALHSESKVLIEAACHTDRLGNPADNAAFSKRRAELVLATLVTHGVDAGHLMAVGSGDLFPVADNATADGRRRNRRLELSLMPVVR